MTGDGRCAVWTWFNPGTESWVVTLHGAGMAYFHVMSFENMGDALRKAGDIGSVLGWKTLNAAYEDVPRWLRPGQ